jgi:predicted acetyltransferase
MLNEIEQNIRLVAKDSFQSSEIENFIQVFNNLQSDNSYQIKDYFIQISTDEGNELEIGYFTKDTIADITLSKGHVYSCSYPLSTIKKVELTDDSTKWTLKIIGEKKFDYNIVKPGSIDNLSRYKNKLNEHIDRAKNDKPTLPIQRPESQFNNDLKEIPVDVNKWELFFEDLKNQLKTETHPEKVLSLHEHIGMAAQILFKLSEAEYFLMKSISTSYSYPKQSRLIQNMIRLAHVYQWKKEFQKSHLLFDQVKSIFNKSEFSESLKASFHQHLGKLYFDQGLYGLSLTEFELALKIRRRIQAPDDQVSSTIIAINETKKRLKLKDDDSIIIRRSEVNDAEAVHHAHMKSINEICSKDHSPEEIRVWGGRQYNPDFRIPAIQEQFYLVVESENKIEGFCQLKLNTNEQGIKTSHLYGLYITPKMLNKGIGSKLLKLALEFSKSENVKEVTLKSSMTALEFYKKHSFVRHGDMSGMVRDGVKIKGYPMRLLLEKPQVNYASEKIETERLVLRKGVV